MSFFEWYETKADGTPSEEPQRIQFKDKRVLFLRWKWRTEDFAHYINLACAVPGTPIDVTHWEHGSMIYSARLAYFIDDDHYLRVRKAKADGTGMTGRVLVVSEKESAPDVNPTRDMFARND